MSIEESSRSNTDCTNYPAISALQLLLLTLILAMSFNIAEGQPVGSITISKNVTDDSAPDEMFDFTIEGAPFSISENGAPHVVNQLEADTYNVTEIVPDGWDLVSIDCGNNQNNGAAVNGVNIVLEEGEDVSCTFNNTPIPVGSITISKNVTDDSAPDEMFDFTIEGTPFSISENGAPHVVNQLEADTYNVTEIVPDGWDLVSIDCGNNQNNGAAVNGVNIVLEEGEDVSCTFNNTPMTAMVSVMKDFNDNNPKNVTLELNCDSGDVFPTSAMANDNGNSPDSGPLSAEFMVTGFTSGTSCSVVETAIESIGLVGGSYTTLTADCSLALASIEDNGSYECAVVNEQDPASLVVNVTSVEPVGLDIACSDGATPNPASTTASEGSPAEIEVTNYPWDGASCSAIVSSVADGLYVTSNDCTEVQTFIGSAELDCRIEFSPTPAKLSVPTLPTWALLLLSMLLISVVFSLRNLFTNQ